MLKFKTPLQFIKSSFLKKPLTRSEIERLRNSYRIMKNQVRAGEFEEFHKNLMNQFLRDVWYGDYLVNTAERMDSVIYNGKDATARPAVIIEVKSPQNRSEMPTIKNINTKALQELVWYFLQEYIDRENHDIKHLVVTNLNEWFIFRAKDFANYFCNHDKELLTYYKRFKAGQTTLDNTATFYAEGAKPAVDRFLETQPEILYLNFQDYSAAFEDSDAEADKKLAILYRVFAPETLLNKPFENDSNSLNKNFYNELLYIIGLEETKENGKKIIGRATQIHRQPGSLLENTLYQLDDVPQIRGDEARFEIALRLNITWINRILFLKLLEAQCISYQKGNPEYRFLTTQTVGSFDELNKLFFKVLAKRPAERDASVVKKYNRVPYLNSSLFEPTVEEVYAKIGNVQDADLLVYPGTVLRDGDKKRTGSLKILDYLFRFLDAYNFASDGSEEIQEESRQLINASVLGLIFEKLNGYKDGSFFTPGFVTEYMCSEVIDRAVVQQFNEKKGWDCENISTLFEKIENIQEANAIMDSLRICDPAVGSGHFLVSALNRLVYRKWDLGILCDKNGKRIKKTDWEFAIENDELSIKDSDGELYSYSVKNKESQRIQETVFREKRRVIENCLFGVDINPNSVNICRLRLWIELLKNTYYTEESDFTQLETLPNIDINIKCGNSLISRYDVNADLMVPLQKAKISITEYKEAVTQYKNAHNKEEKRTLTALIEKIRKSFRNDDVLFWDKSQRLAALHADKFKLENQQDLLETKTELEKKKKTIIALNEKIGTLEKIIENIKSDKIYEGGFEWRFEFPELLDNDGNFMGFDACIGNPPYIQLQSMGKMGDGYGQFGFESFTKTGDIYCLFYELGYRLIRSHGILCFITSNKWMRAGYGEALRNFFAQKTNPILLIDFAGTKIFEEATVDTNILAFRKESNEGKTKSCIISNCQEKLSDFIKQEQNVYSFIHAESWVILSPIEQRIKEKIEKIGTPLKDWDVNIYRGVLTGYNEAFIISGTKRQEILDQCSTELERTRTDEIMQPILRGRDIKRYSYEFADLFLIATFPSKRYNIDDYPAVKEYLLSFGMERLEQTGKEYIINGQKIKARKKTNNKWFETQDSISYWDDFNRQKIVWKRVGSILRFCFDDQGCLALDSTCFATGNHLSFLVVLLNSPMGHYLLKDSPKTGTGDLLISVQAIEPIKIPLITKEQEKASMSFLSELINHPTKNKEILANQLIYSLYQLTQDEIKFIESINGKYS